MPIKLSSFFVWYTWCQQCQTIFFSFYWFTSMSLFWNLDPDFGLSGAVYVRCEVIWILHTVLILKRKLFSAFLTCKIEKWTVGCQMLLHAGRSWGKNKFFLLVQKIEQASLWSQIRLTFSPRLPPEPCLLWSLVGITKIIIIKILISIITIFIIIIKWLAIDLLLSI